METRRVLRSSHLRKDISEVPYHLENPDLQEQTCQAGFPMSAFGLAVEMVPLFVHELAPDKCHSDWVRYTKGLKPLFKGSIAVTV